MATLPIRTFATLVGNFAAGVQGRAAQLIDFSVGSVLRAVAEAASDLGLWLQSLVVYVLTLTRAATSTGADLDTWMADWFFTRLPAKPATGLVTFARFSVGQPATVPVGAEVGTDDGALIFRVTADPAHPAYDATAAGYVLPAGTTSVAVPVAAVLPAGATNGAAWNVGANRITQSRSGSTGLSAVTNAAPFTTGLDAESDPAFRERFRLYIAGLSKGTEAAIRSAIANVRQALQVSLDERPGYVTVYVDDGTGSCSADLLALIRPAVDAVRAGGVIVTVQPAQRLDATVSMTVAVAAGYEAGDVVARVVAALAAFINATPLGAPLRFNALSATAFGVPGVSDVTAIRLNGDETTLVPLPSQAVKAGSLIVSPTV